MTRGTRALTEHVLKTLLKWLYLDVGQTLCIPSHLTCPFLWILPKCHSYALGEIFQALINLNVKQLILN